MNRLRAFFSLPRSVGWRDHAIGAFLAIVYVAWLLATARSLGFPRDEGFYFHAAREYARWFELLFTKPHAAFAQNVIDASWSTNHEHPSLMKSLFALSWMAFYGKWQLFTDASTAFRLPGMAMGGIALWVTYLFGARVYGRDAGLMAAVLLALMPRIFFHAHLACFDVPIMTMWTWCIYVYWRSLRGGLAWAIAAGVMYGLTLDTKHNAWILPAVFLSHSFFVHGRATARHLRMGLLSIPVQPIAMLTIGPLVLYALWPWIWNDTLPRLQEWLNFHLNHDYYNMEFLGKNYFSAPSPPSYAPVMIVATVPTITLVLFGIGGYDRLKEGTRRVYEWAREQAKRFRASTPPQSPNGEGETATNAPRVTRTRDRYETDLLLALSLAAPLAPFFLPKTPIFGGTKHWFPAYPFLAIFAGRGFSLVALAMKRAWPKLTAQKHRLAEAGLFVFLILGPLAITIHSHPFGLSAYVPLVGGTAGGADLGLNRQFWGFTTQSVGPWLATNAPKNAAVYMHDTAWESWQQMITEGRLRRDLRGVGAPSESDIALVQHELHMNEIDYQIWSAFGTAAPAYVLTHDGVPIVSVYRRP